MRPAPENGAPPPARQVGSLPRGNRRRRLAYVLTASVLLVGAAGAGGVAATRPGPAGPEFLGRTNDPNARVQLRTPREVGSVFTDGSLHMVVTEGPIYLQSIRYSVEGETAELIGEPLVAPLLPDATSFLDTVDMYPLTEQKRAELRLGEPTPISQAVLTVPAGKKYGQYVVLLGFKIVGEGRSVRGEADVVYKVPDSWRKRRLHIPMTLVICSPPSAVDSDRCNWTSED